MTYRNDWHLMSSERVAGALETDKYKGLSRKSAERRRRRGGDNSVWYVRRVGAGDVARATVFDLATILLVITTAAAAMFEMSSVAISMLVILLVAGAMRMTAYLRASRILESMAEEKIPVSSVIRDGKSLLLRANEIVEGDVIFVEAGDVIPCDGRVISAGDSVVIENGITENTVPVHKFDTIIKTESDSAEVPAEYRSNMVFAGSVVKSGKIRLIATATGENTLLVRRQGGVEITPSDGLSSIESLSKMSRVVSLVMLVFVMLITVVSLFVGDEFTLPEVFLSTMAMATAAMSEFIVAIGYIILSITILDASSGGEGGPRGLKKLITGWGRHPKIIIRNPGKIDDLTSPKRIVFMGSSFFKSGRAELYAYRVRGKVSLKKHGVRMPTELLSLAEAASSATGYGLAGDFDSAASSTKSSRLVTRAIEACSDTAGMHHYSPISHVPSSDPSAGNLDVSIIEREKKLYAVACGPIDAVLAVCTKEKMGDTERELDADIRRRIFTECAKLEFGGAKVLAVCEKISEYNSLTRLPAVTCEMSFVGFFAVAEESERDAAENVRYLKENGVVPVLFTTSPKEDLYYCHRIGLFNKNTRIIPFSALYDNYDEGAKDGVIVSFEAVPEEKQSAAFAAAMDKLSKNGVTAASAKRKIFARAFAKADIGFAVSRGSIRPIPEQLSRLAAVAVYPSKSESQNDYGGLSGMVYAIRLARRAVRNTKSASFYLTATQVARLFVILLSVLFSLPMPSPVFILLWGLVIDFLAAVSMAFNREDDALDDMPRSVVTSVIFGVGLATLSMAPVPAIRQVAESLNISVTTESISSLLISSIVLASAVLSFHSLKRGSLFGAREINFSHFAFALLSVLLALLVMFTNAVSGIFGAQPCLEFAAFALISPIVLLFAFEILKLILSKRSKNTAKVSGDDGE